MAKMKMAAPEKKKTTDKDIKKKKKRTLLKTYLHDNDITQGNIRYFSGLSGGCVSKLVSKGKGNKSTKKLVALYLKLTDQEFDALLAFEE